jgi:hypothetical protein
MTQYFCQLCGRVSSPGSSVLGLATARMFTGCTEPACPMKKAMRQDQGRLTKYVLLCLAILVIFFVVALVMSPNNYDNGSHLVVYPPGSTVPQPFQQSNAPQPQQSYTPQQNNYPPPESKPFPSSLTTVTLQRPQFQGGPWVMIAPNGATKNIPESYIGPDLRRVVGNDLRATFRGHTTPDGNFHFDQRIN